jgi:hypothetical protein
MTRTRLMNRFIVIASGALLLIAASAGGRVVGAQSQGYGAVLAGTWIGTFPGGLSSIATYNRDGTFVTMRSHEFGGSPRPGVLRSSLRGSWRQAGDRFESVAFSYNHDGETGEAIGITRIRAVFALDPGFETFSGEFWVAQWACPTSLSCPDPLATAPDVPEFYGSAFASRRVRVR